MLRGVLALVLVAALAGCTAHTDPVSGQASPSASAALSAADAGKLYLDIVCPPNTTIEAVTAAVATGDLPSVTTAAGTARDAAQGAAKRLDTTAWPANVSADVAKVVDNYLGQASYYNALAHAGTYDVVLRTQQPTMDAVVSQRIRLRLGLSADTIASCAGHTGG